MGMSFELPDAYEQLKADARKVTASVADHAAVADDSDGVDPVMREALVSSGLTAWCVPAAYGGRHEKIDSLAITVVREVLMGTSAHLDGLFGMQGVGSYALSVGGSDAVREAWLPRIARLDAVAALALTEPDVGSDLKAITTSIEASGDRVVVSGHKSFITNAGAADCYTVLGREGDGYSLVFVPADTPGVRVVSGPRLLAPHIIGDVHFDRVEVPAEYRVGAPGEAFRLVLATLATFRVSVAGAAVGLAQAALDEAVRHTTSRSQFGAPLWTLGPLPHLLGTSWTEIEMARALTYRAASRAAVDPLAHLDLSSMAKVAATEVAGKVTDRAVQMMGRFGIVTGSTIDRLYRNARPMRIYEGGNEVLTGQLARRLTKRG
ncbi:acyl-CoA dehydrogenase family protein [Streptomyces adelaidensis]|uniref:acyl-CoA dehydrogenase family protein n=1 Tax=Streptomyces adelaidensis TaxID=2796465 RepID=UPI0019069C13|nr:acyl-CoA dehydrogenase family protein [Streptomyces adelaidensis]